MLVTSTLFSPFHTLTLAPFPAHQLPGDSPHTPSVPNDEEMVRQNEHGQALPRLNFAASTDDQAAASHGEGAPQGDRDRAGGREEREAERSAGAGAAVSGPGVGVGGGHVLSRPLQAGGATRRSDGVGGGQDLSLHEVSLALSLPLSRSFALSLARARALSLSLSLALSLSLRDLRGCARMHPCNCLASMIALQWVLNGVRINR